jgi:hypothetical protein
MAMAMAKLQQDIFEGIEGQERDALNWKLLVDICGRHKLVQPLMDVLPDLSCRVPKWVRPSLWARLRRNRDIAQRHIETLCRLSVLLSEKGVEFRVMRGPVLSMLEFGEPGKREYCDLDIVVDRQDIGITRELLNQHGFQSGESTFIVEQNCAYQMYNREIRVGVDLHWSTVPDWLPVGKGLSSMTDAPVWLSINDTPIPTFDKEATLVIQCVQCMKTAWVELDRWRDFALLCIRWNDVDWHRVVGVCRDHGYLRSLALTLHLLGPVACHSIPESILAQLEPDANLDRAEKLILARLPEEIEKDRLQGRSPEMMRLSREYLPYWVYKVFQMSSIHYPIATWWLVTDDSRQRRGYNSWIIRSHFSPKQADYDAVKLPQELHLLYYLVRPLRLLSRGVQSLYRKIARF